MKLKNILITGGLGYIGSHTAVVLARLGYKIVLLDNLSNSSCDVVETLQKILGIPINFVQGDVRDTGFLIKTISSQKIDAVVHFAGLKAVGDSVKNPIDYYDNNVHGTISLLKALKSLSISKLIFSSSATIYGEPKYLPLDEKHQTSSDPNPYGRTKIHIEEILKDLTASDPDFCTVCLRYFNPVGAHDSGLIGDNPKGTPNNLMPFVTQVAIGDREKLNVFGNDYPTTDGTGVRDYIHVMDLAEGHAASFNFLEKNKGWHAINLGTGKGYSVLEIINTFRKVSNCDIPYNVIGRRAGDIAKYYANPEKAAKLLGWKTKRTLKDMCSSAWHFQQSYKLNSN